MKTNLKFLSIFVKIKSFEVLPFGIYPAGVVKKITFTHRACYSPTCKCRSDVDYLILQNIPQLVNPTLMHEFLWNHKLNHQEKQERACLALLGNNFVMQESIAFTLCNCMSYYLTS